MPGRRKTAVCVVFIAAAAWLVRAYLTRPDPSHEAGLGSPELATPAVTADQPKETGHRTAGSSTRGTDFAPAAVLPASDAGPPTGSFAAFEGFMADPEAHPESWLVIDDVLDTNRVDEFVAWDRFDRLLKAFEDRIDAQGQQNTAQVLQMLYTESAVAHGTVIPHVACGHLVCAAKLQTYDRAALQTFNLSGIPGRPLQMEIGVSVWPELQDVNGILTQRVLFTLGYELDLLPVEPEEQADD